MRIGNERNNLVSRAENKLADFCEFISFSFKGKTVLDIGSSTGGFTEYALRRGALKVIAVEKGTNQMKAPLRFDSRVELHEKTDIFQVIAKDSKNFKKEGGESLVSIETPDVILADVSFISLEKVLKYAKEKLARGADSRGAGTEFLVMVKPQFEAREFELNRGVVKNEKIRREIIKRFEGFLRREGFLVLKKRDNLLAGKNGNLERFYYLKLENKKH